MHIIGRWMGKARAMSNEFRKSFDEMARQAELDELRKEISALRAERPLAEVEQQIEHGILPPADELMQPAEEHPAAKAAADLPAKADMP
jgi:sec-independent protein translocase protein TatB